VAQGEGPKYKTKYCKKPKTKTTKNKQTKPKMGWWASGMPQGIGPCARTPVPKKKKERTSLYSLQIQ
jgi:hypothetical protein